MATVVLDLGHGGHDPGAVSNGVREKDIVLRVGRMIRDYLTTNYHVNVTMTRDSDVFVSLQERSNISNKVGASLFVSIHVNAGGGTGYEDYIFNGLGSTSPTHDRRNIFHSEVVKVLDRYKLRNRGKKTANFAVLRNTNASAILTELAFIDNARDRQLLTDDRFLIDISIAHAVGIAKALNLKPKKVEEPVQDKTEGVELMNWQKELGEKALDDLHKEGLINNPDDWKDKLGENTPNWLFFEMINRVSK